MKNSKKLLILVLSLVLLIGVFATVAFAEGSDKVSVSYPDGTVVEYGVGETIVPPTGDTYAGKGNTLYKDDDTAGWIFTLEDTPLDDLTVTEDMLGKTVVASGYDKVYYTITVGDSVEYVLKDNLSSYAKVMKHGGCTIKIYSDITMSGGFEWMAEHLTVDNISKDAYDEAHNAKYYVDINGHTIKSGSTSQLFNIKCAYLYIYSSQPGGLFDAPKATLCYPNNDEYAVEGIDYGFEVTKAGAHKGHKDLLKPSGRIYLGERDTSKTEYGENITFITNKVTPDTLYGTSVTIAGGTYIQSEGSTVANFLQFGRYNTDGNSHVQNLKNATFVLSNPSTAPLYLRCGADRTFTNCTFISPNTQGAELSAYSLTSMPKTATFVDCTFINVKSGAESAKVKHTNTFFGGVAPDAPAGKFILHGEVKTFTANGVSYSADMQFSTDKSSAYGVNWGDAYTDYWALGATPYLAASPSRFSYIDVSQSPAVFRTGATFDTSVLTPVTEVQLGTVTTLTPTYTEAIPVAFIWKDASGAIGHVALTEGMTGAQIGQAFYDKFDQADGAYEITLYSNLTLPAAMGWGPLGLVNTDKPEYKSLTKGSITLDLNGYTVTVPDTLTAGINASNSNDRSIYGIDSEGVFGFEVDMGTNVFTLKSSRPGAQILNKTRFALFVVGEGAKANIVIDGSNITYIGKASVSHFFEADSSTKLSVNGGRYVIETNRPAFSTTGVLTVKNAEIEMLGDATPSLVGAHFYNRNSAITLENCRIYAANATPLFAIYANGLSVAKPNDASCEYSLTIKDCYLLGALDVASSVEHLDALNYEGRNYTLSAESAMIANPAGVVAAKTFMDLTVAGETKEYALYLGVKESEALKVYYEGVIPTEYYLPGSPFRPAKAEDVKTPYFLVDQGIFVNISGYKSPMLFDTVTDAMVDTVLNAVANINYVENPMAAAVLVGDAVDSYVLLSSETYAEDLLAVIAAAPAGVEIRLYVDIIAPAAVENAAAITLDLFGNRLYVSAPIKANALLTVKNGSVILTAEADVLFDGEAYVENAAVYSIAAEVPFTNATATVKNSRAYNLVLGANATLEGTVFHTDATASDFGAGITENVLNTTNGEAIFVGETRYVISYAYAATNEADKICSVTFMYKGVEQGAAKYYAGSVPSYFDEVVPGYFISYIENTPVFGDAILDCGFSAAAENLQAKIVVTERLNFVFYLQKQEGLENLVFAGTPVDMDGFATEMIDGKEYFVLTYEFLSIANSLDVITLTVDVHYGDGEIETVAATVSLTRYAESIMADLNMEDEDKQLAYSLLAYVDAMLDYFGKSKNETLTALLQTYAEHQVPFVAPEAEKITSDYVRGALYIVNENLDLALRVDPDFKGELIVSLPDGTARTYIYKDIVLLDGYSYIVVEDVAFADAGAGLDVEIKMYGETVETFTYSIANYAQAMAVQNMGYTPVYVKALYNFVSLAARSVG